MPDEKGSGCLGQGQPEEENRGILHKKSFILFWCAFVGSWIYTVNSDLPIIWG